MKDYTKAQFISYVLGWLGADESNRDQLSLNNMKAALNNALFSFDCGDDGFEAYCGRQQIYARSPEIR